MFITIRKSILAAWSTGRARLDAMKDTLSVHLSGWAETIRQTCGTQEIWRKKSDQVIRPLASAVRSLRRRHQNLLDQLNATHSIVQKQQQDLTDLALQLASVKAEIATHQKTIDEQTNHIKSLQAKVSQVLPTTHGTTGQSGPSSHGRRSAAATKRNGETETGPQSRAEH
jgi:chromosome segregation ATPase